MVKKALWCLVAALIAALIAWDIFYIAVLIDSFVEEYILGRFFYWGYPQWGALYSSSKVFLWFNLVYIFLLSASLVVAFMLRRTVIKSFVLVAIVACMSFANMYVSSYNWNQQFKMFQNERGGEDSRVPEGVWIVDLANLQRFEDQTTLSKVKGWWGRGHWPGGYAIWGDYRVWLVPTEDIDVKGRRGLVLHGGTKTGSPWGINLGASIMDLAFKMREVQKPFELNVAYSANNAENNE